MKWVSQTKYIIHARTKIISRSSTSAMCKEPTRTHPSEHLHKSAWINRGCSRIEIITLSRGDRLKWLTQIMHWLRMHNWCFKTSIIWNRPHQDLISTTHMAIISSHPVALVNSRCLPRLNMDYISNKTCLDLLHLNNCLEDNSSSNNTCYLPSRLACLTRRWCMEMKMLTCSTSSLCMIYHWICRWITHNL